MIVCVPAWACSCGAYPSAKDAWLESPLIFGGIVEKTDPALSGERIRSGEQIAWVRVTEPFTGVKTDQVLELRINSPAALEGFMRAQHSCSISTRARSEALGLRPPAIGHGR